MIEVTSNVEVEAAPDRVWRTLTDFAHFRQWHPFLELEGVAEKGARVGYWFRLDPAGPRRWDTTALVKELEAPRALVFELGIRGLIWVEERFELSEAMGGTLVKHDARFTGFLPAVLPSGFIQRRALPIYKTPIEWLQRYLASSPGQQPTRLQRRRARHRQ